MEDDDLYPDGTCLRALYIVDPEHWKILKNTLAAHGMTFARLPARTHGATNYCLTPITKEG